MRARRSLLLLSGVLALIGLARLVQAQPVGPEFQVNTYTTGNQGGSSVAADASGNFVVIWHSFGQDGSNRGVFGQRYDSEGLPQGGEFRVNSYTTGDQERPSVASDASGNFVVVWQSYRQDGSADGIFGQRYDGAGNALGTEFRVNSYTTQYQGGPAVASDANGNFVVVWTSTQYSGGVFGQRYDSAGVPLGSEFAVTLVSTQADPSVASDASGAFVVVWVGGVLDIFGQRYDSGGVPQGTEFRVNSYTLFNQSEPSVASDPSGNFVVVWNGTGPDDSNFGVFGQRYDSRGLPQGTQFRVNSYTTSFQQRPSVSSDASGNAVVVWQSATQDGGPPDSPYGVFGQRYDSDGAAQGSEFQVNTFTTNSQQFPSVATTSTGRFVVAWESLGQDGSGYGIFGQRFDFSGGESTIHVGDLDRKAKNVGASWRAQVKTLVHDDTHLAESGVLVTFNVSGGVGTRTCTTTSIGICEVSVVVSDSVSGLTFTVTNLSKAGFTYAPGANHDPDPDSDGTVIVVNQP